MCVKTRCCKWEKTWIRTLTMKRVFLAYIVEQTWVMTAFRWNFTHWWCGFFILPFAMSVSFPLTDLGSPHLVANWMQQPQLSHPSAHYAWALERGVSFQVGLTENSLVLIGFLIIPITVGVRMGWDELMEFQPAISAVGVVGGTGPQRRCREIFPKARGNRCRTHVF